MATFRRATWALFIAVLLAWDPQSFVVSALVRDADTPNPPANIETIRECSLIIPMGSMLQSAGTPNSDGSTFNMKAYGLINHLLWSNIMVKWVIRSGKSYGQADISNALIEPIEVYNNATLGNSTGSAIRTDIVGSAFVIPITYTNVALQFISAYNARYPTAKVKVYRLKETVQADVRYTLTKKPFAALLNSSTNWLIHRAYMENAGFVYGLHFISMSKEEANSLHSGVCVSVATEPHFEGPFDTTNPAESFVEAMHDFVGSGGNFLAQCGGIRTYENCAKDEIDYCKDRRTGAPMNFISDRGIDTTLDKNHPAEPTGKTPTTQYYYNNADVAWMQFDGIWPKKIGGSVDSFDLWRTSPLTPPLSNLKPNAYFTVQIGLKMGTPLSATAYNTTYLGAGVKNQPGRVGTNVWFTTGHDSMGNIQSMRAFINVILVPAERDVSCGFDVDPCAWGGCGTYVKRAVELDASVDSRVPCGCNKYCDNAGNCEGTPDPVCPLPAPPKAAPVPVSRAPVAPRTPSTFTPASRTPSTNTPASNTPGAAGTPGAPGVEAPPPVINLPPSTPVIDVNSTQQTTVEQLSSGFKYYALVVSKDVSTIQLFAEVLNWDTSVTVDLYLHKGDLPTAETYTCKVPNVRSITLNLRDEQEKITNNLASYCKAPLPDLTGDWVVGVYSTQKTGFAFEAFLEPTYGRTTEEVLIVGASSASRPVFLLSAIMLLALAFVSGKNRMLSIFVIMAIVAVAFAQPTSALECSDFTNCGDCLYNNMNCGWCGSNGVCLNGTIAGPDNSSLCLDAGTWEFTYSHVESMSGNDSVLAPTHVEVFLRPGQNLTFEVSLKVPVVPPLDFFILNDASLSMKDVIATTRSVLSDVAAGLQAIQPNTVFGLGSFIEKPIMPYCGWPECYPYKLHQALDLNKNLSRLNESLFALSQNLKRNNEHPECSLDAVVLACQDPTIGFREGSFKIIMVVTDTSSHEGNEGILFPRDTFANNLDGIADGWPPGSGEDYVTPAGLRTALVKNDLNPIFGAFDRAAGSTAVLNYYKNLVTKIGLGAAVKMSNDSQTVIQAVLDGTNEVLKKAVLAVNTDPRLIVKKITPDIVFPADRGTTYKFNITLMADVGASWIGQTANATVKYVGFGNLVTIVAHTAVSCRGCSSVDPTLVLDKCGVCGGNNGCVGCDGIINSGVVFDDCGVCGGDNSTCKGCDGIVNSNVTFDVCGICGGNGSVCAGCDGIPLSGTVVNECGECNGPPNCKAIQGAVIGLSTLAGVAVAAAIAAAIFLAIGAATAAAADKILFQQLNTLKENPLYKEAQSVRSNPLYRDKN